jgi:DNA-binding NarL/FixJ family response regulator
MTDKIFIGIDEKRIEAKGEDLKYILQTQAEFTEKQEALQAEQDAKSAARQSALAKLAALGLTEEEIAAL